VYEYVPDVDGALAELYRVLRPGGRALILDTDWDSLVWNTSDSSLRDRLIDAWSARFAHPHLPCTLKHRLRNAGFRVLRCDVLVLLIDTYDPDTYSLTNGHIMGEFVQHHGLSASDVADWKHSLEDLEAKVATFSASTGTSFRPQSHEGAFGLAPYVYRTLRAASSGCPPGACWRPCPVAILDHSVRPGASRTSTALRSTSRKTCSRYPSRNAIK